MKLKCASEHVTFDRSGRKGNKGSPDILAHLIGERKIVWRIVPPVAQGCLWPFQIRLRPVAVFPQHQTVQATAEPLAIRLR